MVLVIIGVANCGRLAIPYGMGNNLFVVFKYHKEVCFTGLNFRGFRRKRGVFSYKSCDQSIVHKHYGLALQKYYRKNTYTVETAKV